MCCGKARAGRRAAQGNGSAARVGEAGSSERPARRQPWRIRPPEIESKYFSILVQYVLWDYELAGPRGLKAATMEGRTSCT